MHVTYECGVNMMEHFLKNTLREVLLSEHFVFVSGALKLITPHYIVCVCTCSTVFVSSHATEVTYSSVTPLQAPPTRHVNTQPKANPSI